MNGVLVVVSLCSLIGATRRYGKYAFSFLSHTLIMQIDTSTEAGYSLPLLFEKLPDVNQEGSRWTDSEINNAIDLVYQNLNKLESYISFLVRASAIPFLLLFFFDPCAP